MAGRRLSTGRLTIWSTFRSPRFRSNQLSGVVAKPVDCLRFHIEERFPVLVACLVWCSVVLRRLVTSNLITLNLRL